ncbi:MAG: DUF1292 domain-containing protein [Candidatus Dormibacteraeota bacterium]|nr:DUF1292 domain-containing protein [Candidatus Dormibacteraeota bacterium]
MDAERIQLIAEDGSERGFTMHDAIDVEGVSYYLVEAENDPDTVLLLKEVSGSLEAVGGKELQRVLALLEADGGELADS